MKLLVKLNYKYFIQIKNVRIKEYKIKKIMQLILETNNDQKKISMYQIKIC